MKKTVFLCLLTICMLLLAVPIFAAGTTYYLDADDFVRNPGTWTISDPQLNSSFKVMRGLTAAANAKPATATFDVKEGGDYTLWVRTSDTTGGTRNMRVGFDGKLFTTLLGKHGQNGWAWEKAGTVHLDKGQHTLYLVDITMYYARAEAFVLSSDPDFTPPDDIAEIKKGFKDNAPKVVKTPADAMITEFEDMNADGTVVEKAEKPDEKPAQPAEPEIREPSVVNKKADKHYFNISSNHFVEGNVDWSFQTDDLCQIGVPYFNGGTKNGVTASMKLVVPKTGIYNIWARAKDAPSNPGSRSITLSVDDSKLTPVGVHGMDGWEWEKAGKVELSAGEHTLTAVHTGAYGRMDMILITDDMDFIPPWENEILADWLKTDSYDASKVEIDTSADDSRPDSEIAVRMNGEWMHFDVDPILMNDRTMVPLRAIFEALGATVSWNDASQTATGNRNGRVVQVTIDSQKARINGEIVEIDQAAALVNDRTLVPLRFISEAYGATVNWDDATQTVSIVAESVPQAVLLMPANFSDLGDWAYSVSELNGKTSGKDKTAEEIAALGLQPANASFLLEQDGKYNVWVYAKDYATNQQGSRFYEVSMDGVRSTNADGTNHVYGAHGKEGFIWEKMGTYDLAKGVHTISLHDTSAFYARCGGVFITEDLNYVPSNVMAEVQKVASGYDPFAENFPASYPTWAKQEGQVLKTESIENETSKIVLYQVQGPNGVFVQDEIFEKYNGEWKQIKKRTEEGGLFLMYAAKTSFAGNDTNGNFNVHLFSQTMEKDGAQISTNLGTYYKAGDGYHMLGYDFEKTADGKLVLKYDNDLTSVNVTYSFDGLCDDIRVDLDASIKKDGAYSFMIYSGDGVTEEQFDTVTAPLLLAKHALPKKDAFIGEDKMFTPMNTFYYTADNNVKTPGVALTSGFAVDPSVVGQDYVYPDTITYGMMFRTLDELVRPQILAPAFGSENANKKAGENYHFAYRIVNDFNSWENTFMRIAEDMYNYGDIRTNYYASINEAIYNTIDLLKDDFYGGWDEKGMGNYNMERTNLVSISNPQAFGQVYLWTDDEDFLERRLIPSIAFTLTRGSYHITVQGPSDTSYTSGELGTVNPGFDVGTYAGLYEMSQGRIPYLMEYAMNGKMSESVDANIARYKYTGDESYKKSVIARADEYLLENPDTGSRRDKNFVNVFVYVDYIIMVDTFLNAYEFTGEQKYLDAAKDAGYLLATGTWTTGYQNDYATTDYVIDPDKVYARGTAADGAGFFWHGDFQWRPGNEVIGEYQTTREMRKVDADVIPGWLSAKAGMGTEHPSTPGNGNIITMNNWTGAFLRLAEYTGEDFFKTMAHNATIGRFSNYPGYYQDRYISHQMKPDYPYNGPDYTSIYWHHIPVFLGMLQDYLVNSVWERSDRNIEFDATFQSGYAYFNNYCYGQTPGKFYDQTDMYLWVDRGIIDTNNNVNIDYIAGRKDGVLALALLNEAQEPLTETITLGEKVAGGSAYNGKATLYDAQGNKSEIDVVNGAFTVTIPVRGIQTVIINIDGVTKPHWAKEYTYSNALGDTVVQADNGGAYLLQFSDNAYYAYLYTNEKAENTQSVTFVYTIDGVTEKKTIDKWPFETIIKVEDTSKAIDYNVEVLTKDGKTKQLKGGILRTLEASGTQPELSVVGKLTFEPVKLNITYQGLGGGGFRLIDSGTKFPFEVTNGCMTGMRLKGKLKGLDGNPDIEVNNKVVGCEARADGSVLIEMAITDAVPALDYCNEKTHTHDFELMLYPID